MNRKKRKALKMHYKLLGMRIYTPKPTDTIYINGMQQSMVKMAEKGYVFSAMSS